MKRLQVFTIKGIHIALLAAMLTVWLAASPAPAFASTTYTLTDLGNLGYPATMAYGINASGQIVGRSTLQQTVPASSCPPRRTCFVHVYHAFLYSAGKMTDIGTLGGTFSDARAIDDNGDIVGFSTLSGTSLSAPTNAFLYTNGQMKSLGTLGGGGSHAYGINNFAEVVGDSYTASGADHAFLYSNGKMADLGTLGANPSKANDINNLHQVVGSSEVADGSGMHAFLWGNGTMQNLGTLGGTQSIAYAVNDSGQVVGYASPVNSSVHAFLYSSGKMTDLGVFFDSSVAEAINNSGVVVGQADTFNGTVTQEHAFVYAGGKLQDLNNLIPPNSGWVLTEATGINDLGQIICNGNNLTNGQNHAFLLNP